MALDGAKETGQEADDVELLLTNGSRGRSGDGQASEADDGGE